MHEPKSSHRKSSQKYVPESLPAEVAEVHEGGPAVERMAEPLISSNQNWHGTQPERGNVTDRAYRMTK
jgi:hypothetical protein